MANGTTQTKLYPPTIGSSVPAFYKNASGTAKIAVPFVMSRAVDLVQVKKFKLKIKSAQTNTYLATLEANSASNMLSNPQVDFYWTIPENIKVGQYFKVQLAYVSQNDVVGYFSTVAITKYTAEPTAYIDEFQHLEENIIPLYQRTYTGIYEPNPEDTSERPYSYQFTLFKNVNGELQEIESSGWLLHNSSVNRYSIADSVSLEGTIDTYTFKTVGTIDTNYSVVFQVKTINGLTVSSPYYPCVEQESIPHDLPLMLLVENIFDDGYIKLSFKEETDDELINEYGGNYVYHNETSATREIWTVHEGATLEGYSPNVNNGDALKKSVFNNVFPCSLEIFRAEEIEDESQWQLIQVVYFDNTNQVNEWSFRDLTIEQGITYQYSFRQYTAENFVSGRQKSTPEKIVADFEDMFLCDSHQRQIKIRFNPKVSSFKITKLEQKIDTIGSKFPFIFSNSVVAYKEFPIGGLISYLADDNELFVSYEEDLDLIMNAEREGSPTSSDNYEEVIRVNSLSYRTRAERIFKLELLDWLNDGEIKLFKSATEGNYLVRLLNISLTPEDKLGRMLHNFSATAYEMMELSYDNLMALGFIDYKDKISTKLVFETVNLLDIITDVNSNQQIMINQHSPIINNIEISIPQNLPQNQKLKIILGEEPYNVDGPVRHFVSQYNLPNLYIIPSQNSAVLTSSAAAGITITYGYEASSVAAGHLVNQSIILRTEMRTYFDSQTFEDTSAYVVRGSGANEERYSLYWSFEKFLSVEFIKKSLRIGYLSSGTIRDLYTDEVIEDGARDLYSIYSVLTSKNSSTLSAIYSYIRGSWQNILPAGNSSNSDYDVYKSYGMYNNTPSPYLQEVHGQQNFPDISSSIKIYENINDNDPVMTIETASPLTYQDFFCKKIELPPTFYMNCLYQIRETRVEA